ncbi:MAG: hypothetical protein HY537_17145 [Deltaproteobacteria bacterium]|nr:hypothetical protein [Deltaproteobacteria bacterium]
MRLHASVILLIFVPFFALADLKDPNSPSSSSQITFVSRCANTLQTRSRAATDSRFFNGDTLSALSTDVGKDRDSVHRWQWLQARGWIIVLKAPTAMPKDIPHVIRITPFREIWITAWNWNADYDFDLELVGAIARAFFFARTLTPVPPISYTHEFQNAALRILTGSLAGEEAIETVIVKHGGAPGSKLRDLTPKLLQEVGSDLVDQASAVFSECATAEAKWNFLRRVKGKIPLGIPRLSESEMVTRLHFEPGVVRAILLNNDLRRRWTILSQEEVHALP